ncbi:N-acetylmannosamine-6-phosphate 2-epimerase [Kurthia gibsonii]|uniref:N-acetylmannosamine-6-phosphate 2-epimerase n=1 Tax=Kurthia gibsonii TaxID=33946 RepID=UPI000B3F5681|nr:N-acetylmannosamine-6-phosphate 2-epimerase [Kurthia gibsonii]RXH51761.1 N-acetylmannosamine-6-phosphate 2-epimerase [Kurthia gibsonii]HZG12197.1 N-acetylmannosamine-6-phosphate 2-epimerase [Kurthia gibsonii]
MTKKTKLWQTLKNELIVSCQALPEEPLHSSLIMGKMAYAAKLGGAKGIRSNSVDDIREIKKTTNLPIIGIIKKVTPGCSVFITPTEEEVVALYNEGVDIIAMDATNRKRPNNQTILEFFKTIRARYPDQLFMADCATFEEAKQAVELGFDCIGTTLCGYTEETKGINLPNFNLIQQLATSFDCPIIAEGGIWTPEDLKHAFECGAHTAVVGTAITRPMDITKRFVKAVKG